MPPASQVAPDGQDTHSAPSAAGLPSLPAVWPSLFPVQPLTYGRARAALPAGVLVPSLRPDPLGLVCNPPSNLAPLQVGRKVYCLPVLFLQVQVIKMAFPTLKSGSFFQVRWWNGRHQGALDEEVLEVP